VDPFARTWLGFSTTDADGFLYFSSKAWILQDFFAWARVARFANGAGRLHRRGALRALAWGGFTAAGHCAFPLRCYFKRNLDVFHENQVYVLNFFLFCIFILIQE